MRCAEPVPARAHRHMLMLSSEHTGCVYVCERTLRVYVCVAFVRVDVLRTSANAVERIEKRHVLPTSSPPSTSAMLIVWQNMFDEYIKQTERTQAKICAFYPTFISRSGAYNVTMKDYIRV